MYTFTVLLTITVFTSCNKSQNKIDKIATLIQHAEESDKPLTSAEIDEIDLCFTDLDNYLASNRSDFTEEQVQQIGKLKGRYTALTIKKGVEDFKQTIEDIGNQMEGILDGVTDTTKNKTK